MSCPDCETFEAQAIYEREARIAANDFPRNRNDYIACERCGVDCGMDAFVPNEIWDQITPHPEFPEAGMLCLWCMDEICVEKGITATVKVFFVGKALKSEAYP